ncbi:type II toxin-antitoxin system RelE/ParE family toxin [Aquimarina sp. ERC-38]|uniref:type II toxin-antitoxin system RelE/ParE family toxin n=1 Tax=Aquimarina sp. ERC-38 TaxID=2949996 RepID=UPI00224754EB|nr:type II toxin-antitoxin system RelE/ParE family toxin [Aquimarina sp. ERC-38]UZO82260.1 type II toxin-antitoxin system RelE/ParE family toxin [Aquimarina sp. ERC-38]
MKPFNREIRFFKNHFIDFYNKQSKPVRKKIDWTLLLIKTLKIVPEKFLKHLTSTEGLWEIRVAAGNGIYRIFCFFDDGNLVVILSAFQKKTQKTPKGEIDKAKKLKKEYYERK